ncbi:MAG: efflux RND transporter periplasmic adaptor subunit [Clostridiales Family XIII bacterium]|nr:efflux RND transporter periplasmic adaptor subunit [Clostridiales Family XIII bacterium]
MDISVQKTAKAEVTKSGGGATAADITPPGEVAAADVTPHGEVAAADVTPPGETAAAGLTPPGGVSALLPAFIFALVLLLTGCNSASTVADPPQSVSVMPVTSEIIAEEMVWSGQIAPAETTKLSFKVAGVIEDIYVHAGDTVTAGQLLARLQPVDYEIQVRAAAAALQSAKAQAERILPAQLSQAQAQLDLTLANYDRIAELYKEGAATAINMDEITAKKAVDEAAVTQATEALRVGRAEAERAQAAYDLPLSNLEATEITSPWDGQVLQVIAASGESTAAGYPVLALGRTAEMWAEVGLTDAEASRLTPDLAAEVYVYGAEDTWHGKLEEIGALADSMTRNFTGRVRLENPDGRLRAGMITQVSLELPGREYILVPVSSVLHLAASDVVYVYDAGVARRRQVETGEILGDRVEVRSGLAVGDSLIVEGQSKLQDGDEVKPL